MQYGVAACNVEIRSTAVNLAEIKAVVEGLLHLLPCHADKTVVLAGRIYIAMLAPLVTFIRYMPLK